MMRLNQNVAISDSGFVFNPLTGDSFSANTLGTEVLHLLRIGIEKKEIILKIQEKYNLTQSAAERDIEDFLDILLNFQLLIID